MFLWVKDIHCYQPFIFTQSFLLLSPDPQTSFLVKSSSWYSLIWSHLPKPQFWVHLLAPSSAFNTHCWVLLEKIIVRVATTTSLLFCLCPSATPMSWPIFPIISQTATSDGFSIPITHFCSFTGEDLVFFPTKIQLTNNTVFILGVQYNDLIYAKFS